MFYIYVREIFMNALYRWLDLCWLFAFRDSFYNSRSVSDTDLFSHNWWLSIWSHIFTNLMLDARLILMIQNLAKGVIILSLSTFVFMACKVIWHVEGADMGMLKVWEANNYIILLPTYFASLWLASIYLSLLYHSVTGCPS